MPKSPHLKPAFGATIKPNNPNNTVGKLSLCFGILGSLGVMLAFLWFSRQAPWVPDPVKNILFGWENERHIFLASVDLNRDAARSLYQEALNDLKADNFDSAIDKFKRLEGVYPGLKDFLWLHEAEAYAGQGNEWAVQKKLRNLIEAMPNSPLQALAHYRIGQSQFRGSEWGTAIQSFDQVRLRYAGSPYAAGSLYYLGALAIKTKASPQQAATLLEEYIDQYPDGKFSGEAADLLLKILPTPSSKEYGLIGLAEANAGKNLQKTLSHLEKGPIQTTWLALGKALIQSGKQAAGIQVLLKGLPTTTNVEEARQGIDLLLAASNSASEKTQLLTQLTAPKNTAYGDYVLWKLAELEPPQSGPLYKTLLSLYPSSDYAPESNWQLLWPLLKNGDASRFVTEGQQFLSRYGYSKAAPKVLFWIGKSLEKNQPAEAVKTYQALMDQYPGSYYAFRAKGRLFPLTKGRPDPGWPTLAQRRDYPPTTFDLGSLDILPSMEAFGGGEAGWQARLRAKELQRIGAVEDLRTLLTESMKKIPAPVESWLFHAAGDRPKGIRAIRDGLEEEAKLSFMGSSRVSPAPENKDVLKLLYPPYFKEEIEQAGQRGHIDPFLVQALMREESYFNEFAISGSNARGLMQLLPSTAAEVAGWERIPQFQTSDLFKPAVNIRLGSRYLAHLHELFNNNSMPAVGAYNGGPGAMKRWTQNASTTFQSDPDWFVETIPYDQSRDYIKKVFGSYWNYTHLYSHAPL